MSIPNIIHFIWSGSRLRATNIEAIIGWHKKSPTSAIWLWTDFHGMTPAEITNLKVFYAAKFAGVSTFSLKDVYAPDAADVSFQVMDDFSNYELLRMRPNYGAYSDIIRYRLLAHFGGGYFDSDVGAGDLAFEKLVESQENSDEHLLFVETDSQNSREIGNDSIVCTKDNPLMQRIAAYAVEHYTYRQKDGAAELIGILNHLPMQLMLYDDYSPNGYIFKATPCKTGSTCIIRVTREYHPNHRLITATTPHVRSLEGYTKHLVNQKAWVNISIAQMDADSALEKIRETIDFEAKTLEFYGLMTTSIILLMQHRLKAVNSGSCRY